MDLSQAQRAYVSDPAFHNAVIAMERWIMDAAETPDEVRAAAFLACYNVQCRNPHPPLVYADEFWRKHGS